MRTATIRRFNWQPQIISDVFSFYRYSWYAKMLDIIDVKATKTVTARDRTGPAAFDERVWRIHIQSLAHILNKIRGLLSIRQLSVWLHSAAAGRGVFELFPGEKPFGRWSPALRHYRPADEQRTSVTHFHVRHARAAPRPWRTSYNEVLLGTVVYFRS